MALWSGLVRNTALAAVLGALVLFPALVRAEPILLFQAHPFAIPRTELAASRGFFDCSGSTGPTSFCHDYMEYMDLDWEVRYRFEQDRLTQVLLLTEYAPEAKEKALKTLASEFFLAAMKSGEQVLDVVSLVRRRSRQRVLRSAHRFEQMGLARSDLVYVLFEKKRYGRWARTARDVRELMLKMSPFTREVDIWVDDSKGDKLLVISFAIPRATMELEKEWAKPRREEMEKTVSRIPPEKKNLTLQPEVAAPPGNPFSRGGRPHIGRL